jgi:hypothetical protein
MPIYDYVLLALLASGDHRLATFTLGPEAIIQPKGGGLIRLADVFSKLGDIKGESLDDKHKHEIELLRNQNKMKFNPTTGPLKTNPTMSPQNNMRMK